MAESIETSQKRLFSRRSKLTTGSSFPCWEMNTECFVTKTLSIISVFIM